MKKSMFVFFLICSANAFAQLSYSFNYKLKIKSDEDLDLVRSFYQVVNSKALQYNLYIGNEVSGDLIDTERSTVTHLYISKEEGKTSYDFLDHLKVPNLFKYTIDNDHISVDQIKPNKYSIKCFEKDAEKPNLELIITLEPINEDLIRLYNITINDDLHLKIINSLKEKLNGNYNYYIKEYIMVDKEGSEKYSIEKVEKIDLNLVNPLKEELVTP